MGIHSVIRKKKLYLSAIIDLYDRYPVAYVISARNDNRLVFKTFDKAVAANPDAKPIKEIKASEVLAKNLQAMDATATAFCLSAGMPVKLFGLKSAEDIVSAVTEGKCGTVIKAE